jgi:hypothetical protein
MYILFTKHLHEGLGIKQGTGSEWTNIGRSEFEARVLENLNQNIFLGCNSMRFFNCKPHLRAEP